MVGRFLVVTRPVPNDLHVEQGDGVGLADGVENDRAVQDVVLGEREDREAGVDDGEREGVDPVTRVWSGTARLIS